MAGTLAFDVKDTLYTKLLAEPGFADMDPEAITYGAGLNVVDTRPRETISIGEIEWLDERAIALGFSRRDEFFTIMITIGSFWSIDTQQEANHRVRDRMKTLEAMVRDPRWSGLPIVWTELKPRLLGEGPTDGGRGAILVLHLSCVARKS